VRINVTEHGGVLGLDRQFSVDGTTFVVTEKGQRTVDANLDHGKAAEIAELGSRAVAETPAPPMKVLPSDVLTTTVAVADNSSTKTFTHSSGQPMPAAVKALVRSLKAQAKEAETA
jgi:hypothetical protein